jgi:hypothetical protein
MFHTCLSWSFLTQGNPQHGCRLLVRFFDPSKVTMTNSHPRYDSAFGAPLSRALGIGYIQELVARLTHTRIERHNSSTNSTLDDNSITFPLDHNLYVDATHEVVVLNSEFDISCITHSYLATFVLVITALNLTSFAANGPLPTDHIPEHRSFRVSELAPFATNVQFQRESDHRLPCSGDLNNYSAFLSLASE